MFLPAVYASAQYSITLNALAALCGFVKSPLSVYFVTSMRVLPDGVGAAVGSLVALIVIGLGGGIDAAGASEIRLLVHGLQLIVVSLFFVAERRKGAGRVSYVAP